jgi:crotonobetainyl-CoA:carnitine CoA-transferase CaiB-like acyl-CoA transferase
MGMDAITAEACRRLLQRIGLDPAMAGTQVHFTGADPVIRSRHRYGAATASALGAQGAAIAAIWQQRSGSAQRVEVDLARAVHLGLRTTFNLRQHGHAFNVGSTSRTSNFFLTRDGRHIYLLRNNGRGTITENLIGLLRCPNSTEGIAAAVSQWDSHELEEALAAIKLPGVVARTPGEWLAHPQGRLLAAQPGLTIRKLGDSAPEPFAPAERPLSGIRVLDASHVIAGPSTGRLLAEQGAEVLQVSNPAERETQQIIMDLGFGKRAAYIDLQRVQDVAQLRQLAAQADVFIDSYRPGAMMRRGFGPDDLAAIRPGIIYVSISCYGFEGPWATRGGYEPIGQAASGLSVREGHPDAPRNAPTITMNDYLAAYLAGTGALGALLRRAREGGSWHVTTSLTQASMWVLSMGELPEVPQSVPDYVPREGDILTAQTVFGELQHVAPITQYSATPGYWSRMPQPAGASRPEWDV